MFRDGGAARAWLVEQRWAGRAQCPRGGTDNVQADIQHPAMTHRCRRCPGRPMFSVKTGTVREKSKLPCRIRAIGIYLLATHLQGLSSLQLHRELGLNQKAAWFLLHRRRLAFETGAGPFAGPVEGDETYMGGKEKNKHEWKKRHAGRGVAGKTPVVGMKDRETNRIDAEVVERTDKRTLQEFVQARTKWDTTVYTDEFPSYRGIDRAHEVVKHSVGEYARAMAHTNGMESFWSMLKRGYVGVYHCFHLYTSPSPRDKRG